MSLKVPNIRRKETTRRNLVTLYIVWKSVLNVEAYINECTFSKCKKKI